ncbi:MAG TPA: alpha/beta fold hydrolase [Candidatus Dormibacteraeota bacterium]|jgi:pimeloyl-ACP methyl ester carboxylesterase|nr:alpha/beta fold hydrolase [Candidatus Dormibacteraeota bacterium]
MAGPLIGGRRVRLAPLAVLLAVAAAGLGGARPSSQLAAGPTPCAAIAALEPQTGHTMPPAAPVLFAADFPKLDDCEWGYPLGGWGGIKGHSAIKHTPVIFVHGNQADAENWYLVADQFKALAGYTDQEMYALSYNGLGNAYAGLPVKSQPAPESITYWNSTNPPNYAICCNGGHGASDDPNVPDLYAFVKAVQGYTGSAKVDIVGHSLGVTITRKMLLLHPELRSSVVAAVMIAGGNHGTTICRGLDSSYYGCEEIAPGTGWLQLLNAAGEAPGPTRWMTVYNGTDNVDPYFSSGPTYDDHQSPALKGAINMQFPQTYHNDLRVDPAIVPVYLKFLLEQGQDPAAIALVNQPQVTPVGGGLPNTSR